MMRRAARHAIATLTMGTRLCSIVGKAQAVVLRYCRVAGSRTEPLPRAVTEEEFEAQLRFLTARCRVVSAREIVQAVIERRPVPPRAVALTFDGGYEDNCSAAFPLLKQYGVPATFFVAAGWVETHEVLWWDRLHACLRRRDLRLENQEPRYGDLPQPVAKVLAEAGDLSKAGAERFEDRLVEAVGSLNVSPEETTDVVKSIAQVLGAEEPLGHEYDPMNWEQLAILREGGMEIGSAAVSDARLTTVHVERAFEELAFSKTTLEDKVGGPIDLVAYPEGCHSPDVADLAEEAGYLAAFTTDSGPVRAGDDRFTLRRISVRSDDCRGAFGSFSAPLFGLHLRQLARGGHCR
jgi:peptidoglycan/xylan/chitin deacetylase (PgdA/CDA1 family)